MKLLFILAWRNIWRNKRRSLITMTSVLFAVFFAIVLRSFQMGAYENMISNMVGSYSGFIQIHDNGFWDEQTLENTFEMPTDSIRSIADLDGVASVTPRLESFSLVSTGRLTKGTLILGIDPSQELEGLGLQEKIHPGNIFVNGETPGVVIGSGMAEYFNIGVGDTLVFLGQGYHGISANAQYPLVGILDVKNPLLSKSLVLMPLDEAQYLYGAQNRLSTLIVTPKNESKYKTIQSTIKDYLPSSYEVMNWEEFLPELRQTIDADSSGGQIFLGVLYMIISFGVFGTILMMTAERSREFGVLISIGMKRHKLALTTMIEATLMSLIGGVAGALLARPITFYFNHNPLRLLGQAGDALETYGFEPLLPASLDWSITLTHSLTIVVISVVLSTYAAWAIFRLKPIEVIRS